MINVANRQQEMRDESASSQVLEQENVSKPSKTDWAKDIKRHNYLLHEYQALAAAQAEWMEKIRQFKQQVSGTDSSDNANASPRQTKILSNGKADLPAVRARLALREALRKLNNRAKMTKEPSLQNLRHELRFLDGCQAKVKTKMREIEARVLTKEPDDVNEVVATLRFVSKVLAFGHKIEDGYLSHVLEDCAETIHKDNAPSLSIVQ
jgi:hypothetical protein